MLWIALSAVRMLRGGGRLFGARLAHWWLGWTWFDETPWNWPLPHCIPFILSMMGLFTLALAIAGFAAGFGLLERRAWARSLAIAVAVVSLFTPILGTVLGIYTLSVLLPASAGEEWRRTARTA